MPAAISPTQRQLTAGAVTALLRERFGRVAVHCGPLTGGTFAAVWHATLDDGTEAVVKIGPPPGVPLLRYERGAIAAEARYYRLTGAAGGVPVPPVLAADEDVILVGRLPGVPLTEQEPEAASAVRRELGTALRHLHAVTGTRFGYDSDGRPGGATWPEAFAAMIADLLADGRSWCVALPVPDEQIMATIARHTAALAEVRTPSLVHFDLWDGNVLAEDGRLTGLVDGERYFWGDPLYDFVSTAIGRRIEDDDPAHPVLDGYYDGIAHPFTAAERARLMMYRIQFCLLLLIEMPSRAMVGEVERERREWVTPWLLSELRDLG